MSRLSISPDELRSLSAGYKHRAYILESESRALPAEVLLGKWEGSGSSAFRERLTEVKRMERELIESYHLIAKMLDHAADAYNSMNANISRALGGQDNQ